ncbi:hypothetical protein [Pontibacter flavimaris]|uniref:Uncharacterized protein n=1 Tax=Pontibacter flavimaris TaxID=1797110 RepID=A0A1Q5PCP8_9BACT|nr:hypothetical protein [Pontibacter flavimaris]OKL39912.1 hypothetical protein A3841_16185 [Pontibacter flavimaris]
MKKKYQDLEIDEDLELERRTWTIQRIVWGLMLLIILAALLGFTGDGGLPGISKKTKATASQHMTLEYERYLRHQVPSELKVTLQQLQTSEPAIRFSTDFYKEQRVEQVVPEPEKVQVGPEGITYTFSVEQAQSHIIFYVKPLHAGNLSFTAHGPAGEAIAVSQFVYP